MRKVHLTYSQPVGEYAIGALGSFVSKSNLNKIEVQQREAARIITGCCKDTNVEHLLCEAGLMPFSILGDQQAALMYECNIHLPDDVPAKITAKTSVRKLKKD